MLERIRSANRADRAEAWFQLAIGIPLFLFGVLMLTAMVMFPLMSFFIPWSQVTEAFIAVASIVVVLFGIDVWLHPTEKWHHAQYCLTSGRVAGPTIYGMPAMASVSDPINAWEHLRGTASGLANVFFAGPRSLRRAAELLVISRARGRPELVDAVAGFLEWIEERGRVQEVEVAAMVSERPGWATGLALADDLGMVLRRRDVTRSDRYYESADSFPPP